MATLESINIRAEAAVKRIEKKIKDWGVKSAPLPLTDKNRDFLRLNQLERIADMLDAVDRTPDNRLQDAIDLVSGGNWTKSQLESILLGDD